LLFEQLRLNRTTKNKKEIALEMIAMLQEEAKQDYQKQE